MSYATVSRARQRGLGQAKWVPGQISFMTLPEGQTSLPNPQRLLEAGLPLAPYVEHGSFVTGAPAIMRYGLDPYRGIMGLGGRSMSYAKRRGMGATLLTANQANDAMGWTKAKRRAYWQQREAACSEMGDEGECLAQVARHIPVTIAGLGGSSAPRKLSRTQARRLARARNEGLLGLGTGILTDQLCNREEYSAGWRTTLNSGLRNASYAAIAGAAAAGAFGAFIGRPLVGAVIGAGLGYGAHIVWAGPFYQRAPAAS